MIRFHFQFSRSPDAAFGGLIGWLFNWKCKFSYRIISNIANHLKYNYFWDGDGIDNVTLQLWKFSDFCSRHTVGVASDDIMFHILVVYCIVLFWLIQKSCLGQNDSFSNIFQCMQCDIYKIWKNSMWSVLENTNFEIWAIKILQFSVFSKSSILIMWVDFLDLTYLDLSNSMFQGCTPSETNLFWFVHLNCLPRDCIQLCDGKTCDVISNLAEL